MKLLAKADILENQKKHKAGDTFETDEATGLLLLEMGWAEPVTEQAKEPQKKKTKKSAKE